MMSTADEHRRRKRHIFDKHVLCYKCVSPNTRHKTKVPFLFVIQDISYGGMGIISDQMLYSDSVMTFRLHALDNTHEFQVKIKWSRFQNQQYVSGLQFVDVVKEDIIFLHKLVKNLG